MKILIIDDEQAIATVFQTALQQGGFTVSTAATGQDGIKKAKAEHPDLIFLDEILPDINGNEILKTLKTDETTNHIPIAILSNFNHDSLVDDAMKMGAAEYILKYQISPKDLVEKAKQIIGQSKGTGWQAEDETVI